MGVQTTLNVQNILNEINDPKDLEGLNLEDLKSLYEKLMEEDESFRKNPLAFFNWNIIPVHKPFAMDTTFERWIFGGKGSAKSTILHIMAIMFATGEYPDWFPEKGKIRIPNRGTIVSSTIERITKYHFNKWMPPRYFTEKTFDGSYNERKHLMKLPNGSEINIMSWDQELKAFKGDNIDWAVIDEHGKKGTYEELKARVRGAGEKFVLGGLTPDEEQKGQEALWEVDEIWEQQFERLDLSVHKAYTGDNPFNGSDYVNQITQNRTEDEKRIILYGEPMELVGLLYSLDKKKHIIDPIDIYEDYCVWIAIDPHPQADTAVTFTAFMEHGLAHTFEELKINGDVRDVCWAIHDIIDKYRLRVMKIMMDPTQVNYTHQMYEDMSIGEMFRDPKIVGRYDKTLIVHPGIGDNEAGIMVIRKWLNINQLTKRPAWTISNKCHETIYSLTHMTRDPRKNKKFDHWEACLRYTFMDNPYYVPIKRRMSNDKQSRITSPPFWNVRHR